MMRTVLLRPGHSSWWLLSPGLTLFFDRVEIIRADYEQTLRQAGLSSYHATVAERLMALVREGCPEIKVLDEAPTIFGEDTLDADNLATSLIEIARNPDDPTLDPGDLVALTADAYRDWIAYNERKVQFLVPDEPMRRELECDLLPEWRLRLKRLRTLAEMPNPEGILGTFLSDETAQWTFRQLVHSAWDCIRLVDSGRHVHDPLLTEYMPLIGVLEGFRSAPVGATPTNAISLFDAYHWRMSRYQAVPASEVSMSDLPRIVRDYSPVRDYLFRIDETLRSVDKDDPAEAFVEARRAIKPLVENARKATAALEWGFWAVGLVSQVASVVGAPLATGRLGRTVAALALAEQRVGRFAGAYALVADSLVTGQRVFHRWASVGLDLELHRRTYWDPARRVG